MIRSTVRIARKTLLCDGCATHRIRPGDQYIEGVISPHHDDLGNSKWWKLAECAPCARRYGRGHLLGEEEER